MLIGTSGVAVVELTSALILLVLQSATFAVRPPRFHRAASKLLSQAGDATSRHRDLTTFGDFVTARNQLAFDSRRLPQ